MESIVLIGLLVMVVYGAVGTQSSEREAGLFTRLRRALSRDHALDVTSMSNRVLLRAGRARPVLEARGTYRAHDFTMLAWEDPEQGAWLELTIHLENSSRPAGKAPYSVGVMSRREGVRWSLEGDEVRALVDAALPHGEQVVSLATRIAGVSGASSSSLLVSSRREVSWSAGFDVSTWEEHGLGLSHLMSWLVALTAEMTTASSSRPISLDALARGLGECVESLVPEVARMILDRTEEGGFVGVLLAVEDEDRARHLERLLRGWWASGEGEVLTHAILELEANTNWPETSRFARRFAARRLEETPDIESGWFWFVRAAHPEHGVPERVVWCAHVLDREHEEHELDLLCEACAPTITRGEELCEVLMACHTLRVDVLSRFLPCTSLGHAELEHALLDVLSFCLQGDVPRARKICALLRELGEFATIEWLRTRRARRRIPPELVSEVVALEDALGHRRKRGAITPSGHRRGGHISISTDPRGQIVVWSEEQDEERS